MITIPRKQAVLSGECAQSKSRGLLSPSWRAEIEPAAESGLEMQGRKVMTTKHCLKYELGGCPHQERPIQFDEPLYLVDEDGLRLRLAFNCRDCLDGSLLRACRALNALSSIG